MCSAALPIICEPYVVGEKSFLDGGMEANLPAGHMKSQGMWGGRCAILIIPHPVEQIDPEEHIGYRVVHFLDDFKGEQAAERERIKNNITGRETTHPAHVQYAVLIISPPKALKSGLVSG